MVTVVAISPPPVKVKDGLTVIFKDFFAEAPTASVTVTVSKIYGEATAALESTVTIPVTESIVIP